MSWEQKTLNLEVPMVTDRGYGSTQLGEAGKALGLPVLFPAHELVCSPQAGGGVHCGGLVRLATLAGCNYELGRLKDSVFFLCYLNPPRVCRGCGSFLLKGFTLMNTLMACGTCLSGLPSSYFEHRYCLI